MVFIWWPFYECKCDHDDDDDLDDLGWLDAPSWIFYTGCILFIGWMGGIFAWGQGWWNPIELIDKIVKCFT